MKKRLMSILLTMAMILSMFPTTAFAEGESQNLKTFLQDKTNYLSYTVTAENKLYVDDDGSLYLKNVTFELIFDLSYEINNDTMRYGKQADSSFRDITRSIKASNGKWQIEPNAMITGSTWDSSTNTWTYHADKIKVVRNASNTKWVLDDYFNIGRDIYVIAEIPVLTVTYAADANGYADDDSLPATQYVLSGEQFTVGNAAALKADYNNVAITFAGWQVDEDIVWGAGTSQTITADTTLTAKWNVPTYNVTYVAGVDDNSVSGMPNKATVDYNSEYQISDDVPTRTNYTFKGWKDETSGTEYPTGNTHTVRVTSNITLTAQWEYKGPHLTLEVDQSEVYVNNTVDVTAYTDKPGGQVLFTCGSVKHFANVSSIQVDGKYFATTSFTIKNTGENTVTAQQQSATVDEGAPDYSEKVSTTVTGKAADSSGGTTSGVIEYSVIFMVEGKQWNNTVTVEQNKTVTEPYIPGVTVEGWYKDSECDGEKFDFDTQITESTTLYAKVTNSTTGGEGETKAQHKVTYIVNGGFYKEDLVDDNGTATSYQPALAGYTFAGWYKISKGDENGNGVLETGELSDEFDFKTQITEDLTLYAGWTKLADVTITYSAGEGITASNIPGIGTVTKGGSYQISLVTPTCEGWKFAGWKNGDETKLLQPGDMIQSVTKDITLTAQWEQDNVTINWPAGTISGVNKVTYNNSDVTGISNVTRGTVVNFYVTYAEGYELPTVTANGVALAAVATADANKYQYTFTANDATDIVIGSAAKVTFTVMLPVSSEYTAKFTGNDGYKYAGWTTAEVEYGGSYTFQMQASKGYTVTSVQVNGEEQLENGATISGIDKGSFTINGVTEAQNIVIVASETPYHTVTYITDGSMTVAYIQEGESIPLPALLDKTGYSFVNWYTDEKMTEEKKVTSPLTMGNADVTLYGKYTAWTGTIEYDGNKPEGATDEVSNVPDPTKKTYGLSVKLSDKVPTLEGYKFLGWSTAKGAEVPTYANGATYSTEIDENGGKVTLYAVWEKLTYTVTLPSGTGFTVNTNQSTTVAHGGSFTFTVTVDRAYAANEPDVKVNGDALNATKGATANDREATWTYTIENIKADQVVSITVTSNSRYTVTFEKRYFVGDTVETGRNAEAYTTRQVEHGDKVEMPTAPEVEGYTFAGWYYDKKNDDSTTERVKFDFATPITANTTVYAKMVKITPTVTFSALKGTGWEIKNVKATVNGTLGTQNNASFKIDYGTDVTFDLVISEGYDYSGLSVAANDYALAKVSDPKVEDGTTTISYRLTAVTKNTTITVTGVTRKQVTITYMANAKSGVSGMPAQQVVNYYVEGYTDNDKITKQVPTRTGYEFLGWDTDSEAKADKVTYTKEAIEAETAVADFKKDTTLYAIWKASDASVDLTIQGAYYTDTGSKTSVGGNGLDYVYEGSTIKLVATFGQSVQGTVNFYRTPNTGVDGKTIYADDAWEFVGAVDINGTQVGFSTTVRAYRGFNYDDGDSLHRNDRDVYKAVFTPTNDEGYQTCSDVEDVLIKSTAIAWMAPNFYTTPSENATDDELTIYTDEGCTTEHSGAMKANTTYWLELPKVTELDGARHWTDKTETASNGKNYVSLTVGTHYTVTWQYKDADGHWQTYGTANCNDTVVEVTPAYSHYQFRALVYPVAPMNGAAQYTTEGGKTRVDYEAGYTTCLITQPTTPTTAMDTTTTLTLSGVEGVTGNATYNWQQYEGKAITLTAEVKDDQDAAVNKAGVVTFYVITKDAEGNATTKEIAQVDVNEKGLAKYSNYQLPVYVIGGENVAYFYAVYTDASGAYKTSNTLEDNDLENAVFSNVAAKNAVKVLSTTITWELDGNYVVVDNGNKLTIYKGEGTTGAKVDKMDANTVYTLQIPAVYDLNGKQLTVGTDYTVEWFYKNASGEETKYSKGENSDTAVIDAQFSGYSFCAVVKAVAQSERTVYGKNAGYDDTMKVVNDDAACLTTLWTEAVARKTTTTDLEIVNTDGKLTESKDVAVNGAKPFANDAADHLAQFEGQTITLKATVKEKDAGGKVDAGGVYFYRWDGTTATKLNDKLAPVDSNGVAELTNVVVKAYDTKGDKTAINNVDQFYAVYQTHETWETSDSRGTDSTAYQYANVYIKSTSIKTPIIDSALAGTDDKTATTYTEDLNGLLAGVEHKFTLRQTGADTGVTADWSVVALDGRTVADKNYDIQWLVKTGSNEQNADNDSTAVAYVVENSKFGDQYRVKLIAKGDMKVDAYSNYAIIGTKQDVTVTVTARDEIATTDAVDVYQLNEITLTATVVGANDDATNKPTGTVTFYYSVDNGANWTQIGKATDLAKKDGSDDMIATITTDQLPVKAVDNTKQNVKISALYSGDKTFNAITEQNDTKITQEEVTVYSSVVYVSSIENTTDTGSRKQDGIYISVVEGALLNNESSVTLKLSDVYTLDYNDTLAETVAKLKFDTDYEVEWQILENAAAFSSNYAAAANWQAINGKTGNTCELSVKQGAAYRAKITVKDTAIAKGSFTEVDQTVAGRKVYYSNILVAASAPSTLTVNVNTEKTDAGWEGIVEGEKVTIHTFTAGGSSTPISTLTAKITKQGSDEVVFEATKNDVNGHASFEWKTGADYAGYYTLTVTATYNNGYSDKTITRTLIVRDNDYSFTVSGDNTTYNGKAQGLTVKVNGMDIEPKLADDSVVVYYYDEDGKQVEPTQAGTYTAKIRLQESAYWTEKTIETTFTIAKREVKVVDLVAQAKVYDGTTNANILEIILNDAETDQTTTGLPKKTETTGIINGDSVYAVGTGYTTSANAGTVQLKVKNVVLAGDDKDNYVLVDASYDEDFNIQRSQVKGDIANSTFLYTGSNITVPADDIYLIDQAGNVLGADQYTVTYYYHNGDGVEKVNAMNKLGKYTVIARPDQSNYKGGASETIYVVSENPTDAAPSKNFHSALINISNTVELYGAADNKGIVAAATTGETVKVEYYVSGSYTETVPTNAGRYLVKATVTHSDSTVDTAYGIYTIVKANPVLTLNAENVTYNSAQQKGYKNGTYNGSDFPTGTYYNYTGGTIQGVSYTAPTEAGTYVVTAHVPETANYTAHEVSTTFEVTPKALTITADDLRRQQYGEYPDMVASFDGLATEGVAPDTSLRDVQIQPEMVFDTGYTNNANDQVGTYTVTPVAALARNYTITYKRGSISVTNTAERETLAIHGMIDNGDSIKNIAYYGDVIQLYAYGTQNADRTINTDSSVLEWSVTKGSGFKGTVEIDQNGLLTINGVGTFTVTLKRGVGTAQVSTSIEITALQQEVKVDVPNVDKVYNGDKQTYDGSVKAFNGKLVGDLHNYQLDPKITVSNKERPNIGSQIVTGEVKYALYYISETYGGLFTINDAEITVAPKEVTTTYGTAATMSKVYDTGYTEKTRVNSVAALSNVGVASIADAYGNLDVLDGYEILVAGTEDMNYNVKYLTKNDKDGKDVGDVNVTAKNLTFTTGVINSDGRTSGYMENNNLYYADAGFAVTGTTFNDKPNDRMYGEVNPVMDYVFEGLITDDDEADLADLLAWLTKYDHNINGDANVKFNSTKHLNGYRATNANEFISGSVNDYEIDSKLDTNAVKNYTTTSTEATQNIYQRPVTLTAGVTLEAFHTDILNGTDVKNDVVLKLLNNNLIVGKYNDEGGLATLLGHTIEDLQIEIVSATYDGTGKITVKVKLGNQNYWLGNGDTFEITVTKTKIVAEYGQLGKTSASVTMYAVNESGNRTAPTYVANGVTYLIYVKDENDGNKGYAYYKNKTPVRNVTMTKSSTTGVYVATYDALPAGSYVMFAIAEGYTIIE